MKIFQVQNLIFGVVAVASTVLVGVSVVRSPSCVGFLCPLTDAVIPMSEASISPRYSIAD